MNNDVLNLFDNQRNRGLQGFGLYDGQEGNIVREVREDGILKWMCKYDSNLILFHHRLPTSTDNVRRAAHPFATKKWFGHNQYVLVHNGSISNSRELRKGHEEMGIKYQSVTKDGRFNDSEALLWDFALTMEGRKKTLDVKGGIAFICVKIRKGKPHTLFFGRNSNPLNMKITAKGVRLSSQGEGEAIESNQLYSYDYKTNKLSKKEFKIPNTIYTYPPSTGNWNWQNQQYHRHTVPKPSTAGDWLPDYLRQKYQKTLDKLGTAPRVIGDDRDVLDYDRDGNPIFESDFPDEYDSYDEYVSAKLKREHRFLLPEGLSQDKQEEAELIEPDSSEVYELAFDYLVQAEGNFENAYFMAEQDYEAMFDVPEEKQDEEHLLRFKTMEAVLSEINSDPEYVDENSVSSTWLPLSQQMLTV